MTISGATALEAAVDRASALPSNEILANSCTQDFDQWMNWDDAMSPQWGDVDSGGPGNWQSNDP